MLTSISSRTAARVVGRSSSRRWCFAALAICCAVSSHAVASDEAYPNRPIRMIVPYTAGGPTDLIARVTAKELEQAIKQPVVVDNRGGAGGITGQQAVARATPDGYTILFGAAGSLAISPALYKSVPYDPATAFVPVKLIATAPMVVAVNGNTAIRSFEELRAQSRARSLTYASGGVGSAAHLASVLAFQAGSVQILHVPFNGSAPALNAFKGGHTDAIVDVISGLLPMIDPSQNIRAIAQTGETRSELLPEVPTLRELGYKAVASTWWGILVPKGTPDLVIQRLSTAMDSALAKPEMKTLLRKAGASEAGGTPESFSSFVNEEIRKWSTAAKLGQIERQ